MRKFQVVFAFLIYTTLVFGQKGMHGFQVIWSPQFSIRPQMYLHTNIKDSGVELETRIPLLNRKIDGFILQNHHLGFSATIHSAESFIGASLEIVYQNRAFNIKESSNNEFVNHRALGVQPTVLLKFRNPKILKGNEIKSKRPYLVVGSSYMKYFSYKRLSKSKTVLSRDIANISSGMTGILGIGYEIIGYRNDRTRTKRTTTRTIASADQFANLELIYNRDLYNFFNQNYQDSSISYENLLTKFGYLRLRLVLRGTFQSHTTNH